MYFSEAIAFTGVRTKELNPSELNAKDVYKLLTGSVVPIPIASSLPSFQKNQPFSRYQQGKDRWENQGMEKDTLVNIESQEEFVINVVSSSLGRLARNDSESKEFFMLPK